MKAKSLLLINWFMEIVNLGGSFYRVNVISNERGTYVLKH